MTRSGREPRSAAGTVVRTFRRGCAATRPCSRTGGCAPCRGPPPRPRGRRAAVMRRYPQGSVRGTGLSPDEKGQSASSGSSRRHPARRLVVARPPGTPAPLAHQYRPGNCAPGGKWPPTPGVTSAPPFAKYAAAFLRQLAPPLLALRTAGRAAPPGSRADSLRKPSSPLGGGMIPAVPAHPAHHSSGPADHKKQPPTRSSGPFTRDLTHNPQPRAHPSTTLSTQSHPVPLPEHRVPTVQETPGTSELAVANLKTRRVPPASRRRPSTTVPETLTAVLGITFTYAP